MADSDYHMIDSCYQVSIEKAVTSKRYFYDDIGYLFLRHCTGCDMINIPIEERLENTLAMMVMRDRKMPINEHMKRLFKNRALFG